MQFSLLYLKPNFIEFSLFISLIISTFLISACDQDSEHDHDHDHEEVHVDVDGFILQTLDKQEIYREFKGSTSGNILIKVGQSLELSISFLDDDGNKILDSSDFQDKSIQITEYEETIINFQLRQNIYPYTVLISGLGAGQTFAKLQLNHGGHPDYTATNKILVTVE